MKKQRTPRAPRVKVSVDAETIQKAVKADSGHCMIADALRSTVPEAKAISVDLQTIRFTDSARQLRYTYLTPRIAQIPIVEFDRGIEPQPFSFLLRNGHVTRSGSRKREAKPETQGTADGPEGDAVAKMRSVHPNLGATRLVAREGPSSHHVPERVGGKAPPTTPLARRRAFGLRGLR